jgi:hypothetical protein
VNGKTSTAKAKVAGATVVLALLAPAAARGMSAGDHGLVRGARQAVSAQTTAPAPLDRFDYSARLAADHQRATASRHGRGLGGRDAAVGAGILIAILLLGMWGYVPVGAVVVGFAALAGAAATLGGRLRRAARPSTPKTSTGAPSSSTSSA